MRDSNSKIDDGFSSPNFLNRTLEFLGIDVSAQILSENSLHGLSSPGKEQLSLALAKVIKFTFKEQISPEFFEGMRDAQNKNETNSEEVNFFDLLRKNELALKPFQESAKTSN